GRALGGAIAGGVFAAILLTGIVPRVAQQHRLTAAAAAVGVTLPSVSVTTVTYDTSPSSVSLPGALTAVQTASIYARTPGYVRRRYVDIGTRVRAGQLLADNDAPALDQQVAQAGGRAVRRRDHGAQRGRGDTGRNGGRRERHADRSYRERAREPVHAGADGHAERVCDRA